jgi:cobaltochelatase CobS
MDAQQTTPQPKTFKVSDVFSLPGFPGGIGGYDAPWDTKSLKTPTVMTEYVWQQPLIRDMVMFYFSGDTSLKLIGHTGTGKTEAVKQFHAAVNLPLISVTANPQMSARDLIGGMYPTANGIEWRDGPVTMAARQGISLLIDEYNLLDSGEAAGLNALVAGDTYTIVETGETLRPVKNFRLFATINPKASGYHGRQTQDMSNDERFIDVNVEYASEEVEKEAILKYLTQAKAAPAEAENIATVIVKAANTFRQAYMGDNNSANALPCTMSMRCSLRMARWTYIYGRMASAMPSSESPLYMALDKVLANRQQPEVRLALREAFQLATGIAPTLSTTP